VITLERVSARVRGAPITDVSAGWAEGSHALLGGAGDGASSVLALIGGVVRPRSGVVRVLGGDPTDPHIRRRIAYVSVDPTLPDGLRVEEVLDLASKLRLESPQSARERLALLGIESLAGRLVRSLGRAEARAVALAECVTSSASVIAVEEPFVSVDPRAAQRIAGALHARASGGASVLVATASPRDARELADEFALFRAGAVVGRAKSLEALAEFSPSGARVRILTNDAPALAAALAREEAVEAVARKQGSVVARGRSVEKVAQAVARAVVASGVDVQHLRFEPPSLEEAKAAAEGAAAATYKAAVERTAAEAAARTSAPVPQEPS
jgi:ABC-2 type transport system ATP-binding protein